MFTSRYLADMQIRDSMIYPSNFEQRIGFDRIREQVIALCSMQSAREVIASEGFSTSQREIESRLILADEMRLVISMESGADIGEQDDIASIVEKIAVEGSYITTEEAATIKEISAAEAENIL